MNEYLDRLFPDFEQDVKDIISEHGMIKEIPKGSTVMEVGQYVKSTILVLEGRLKLIREDDMNGAEFFMYYILPGNACALSMVCASRDIKMDVMGVADEDTIILMIPTNIMDKLMRKYKSWYYFVVETYRARFEELLELIDHIAFKKMDERLWAYLENYKEKTSSNILYATHQEIAIDLNSSREVISRLLKKLEQNGLVNLGRNEIHILQ